MPQTALGGDRPDEARRGGKEPRDGRDELGPQPRHVREQREEDDEPRRQERDEPERPIRVGISHRTWSPITRIYGHLLPERSASAPSDPTGVSMGPRPNATSR